MMDKQYVESASFERETGLSKDLLRKWRSRYGFPKSEIGLGGKPVYPREQIVQLKLIKRLLDLGFRPAMIVGKSLSELESLNDAMRGIEKHEQTNKLTNDAIGLLRQLDLKGLKHLLMTELSRQGFSRFVCETLAPLTAALGNAWACGEIEVYHEHLCTDIMLDFLYNGLSSTKSKPDYPKILFATPPDELHILGLLMAQAVLADQGADCVSISSHAPLADIESAARSWEADILAISFSFSFPKQHIRPTLMHLRTHLPDDMVIWVGGAGASHIKRPIPRVRIFSNLLDPQVALKQWVSRTTPL